MQVLFDDSISFLVAMFVCVVSIYLEKKIVLFSVIPVLTLPIQLSTWLEALALLSVPFPSGEFLLEFSCS